MGPRDFFQKHGQVTSKQGGSLEFGVGAFLSWQWLLSLLGEPGLWESGFQKYQERGCRAETASDLYPSCRPRATKKLNLSAIPSCLLLKKLFIVKKVSNEKEL